VRARTCRTNSTGAGNACYGSVAPCAITALCQMSILKQCTMPTLRGSSSTATVNELAFAKRKPESELNKTATAQFYIDIFNDDLVKGDSIRAAAAQAAACICCASDRDDGLLVSFEFILDRILGKFLFLRRISVHVTCCVLLTIVSLLFDHRSNDFPWPPSYPCISHD
jgi:hypothetical protein